MAEVPLRIKILAGMFGLSGVWALLLGVLSYLYETPILADMMYILFGIGAISLAVAYGLYRGFKWAWILGMVMTTASALTVVVQYYRYGSIDFLTLVIDMFLAFALIYSAGYYKVDIPILPKPKSATASVRMIEQTKFFRRVR